MIKKIFYVGSRTVLGSSWTQSSLNNTIEEAKTLMDNDPNYRECDEIPIVQVVAIVKRIKPASRFLVKK